VSPDSEIADGGARGARGVLTPATATARDRRGLRMPRWTGRSGRCQSGACPDPWCRRLEYHQDDRRFKDFGARFCREHAAPEVRGAKPRPSCVANIGDTEVAVAAPSTRGIGPVVIL